MTDLRDDLRPTAPEPTPGHDSRPTPGSGPATAAESRADSAEPGADQDWSSTFRARVRAIDERVEAWFEPYRGRPGLDGAAKVITGLGDHGFMWAAATVWRARRPGPERSRSVRALAVAGIESTLVNSALKRSIGRSRPDRTGISVTAGLVPVREPSSSSFPSGHTLAAFCAATAMCRPDDRSGNALLLTGATLVALSRLHLGAHHASDVVGGALIGTALGLIGRRLL